MYPLLRGETPYFDPVIFQNIDERAIAKAAQRTKGAAGPSGQDADGWRRMLVSRNYGNTGKDLRTAIAKMTQMLCSREVEIIQGTNKTSLEAYTSCRLVPLLKEPTGIRPIGIGEVLRRKIGKAIIGEIKPEIMESAGCLQLCAGQKAGCEAAAHSMKDIFEEEDTDAVLFIDASNAFNSINRAAMIHNIQYLCAPMAIYIKNCYGTPSRLFIAGGKEIQSSEGSTQGDPMAMQAYGIGILPFLSMIKPEIDSEKMKHVAYADDIGGGAKLRMLRDWWDKIKQNGPSFGYFPKAEKSWLVVKEEKLEEALELFQHTGINITTDGRKYLGGFIGKQEGKEKYVQELVDEWVNQLTVLTKIAKTEPQAAYSAFTAGFKHKLTYFIRTIPNIRDVIKQVDDFVDDQLIPAITEGHATSEEDRKLMTLPVRLGGLGIPRFYEICEDEYRNSQRITEHLNTKIIAQDNVYIPDRAREKEIEATIKREREKKHEENLEILRQTMTKKQKRGNDVARMKGASAWLTALPSKEDGFDLNKREFFDAIALRYCWDLRRLPSYCTCNNTFTVEHAMNCGTGGYIIRRHNRLRDLFAKALNDVAYGVHTEPMLQPLTGECLPDTSNREDEARPDIAARGFWQRYAMAFFDVKVFNPFASTYLPRKLEAVFASKETEKRTAYNERCIQIEHGSFTPLVFSAFGGAGRETSQFISKLIEKLSEKNGMESSVVANYLRTKVSFELVRSQVDCIRGSRSMKKIQFNAQDIEIQETKIVE